MATLFTGNSMIEVPDAQYEEAQRRKREAEEAMNRPASDRIMDTPFDPQRVAANLRPFMGKTPEQHQAGAEQRVAMGMGSERDYRTAAGTIFGGPTAVGQDTVPSPNAQQARAEAMNTRTQADLQRQQELAAALEQSRAEQRGKVMGEAVKAGQVRPRLDEAGNPIAGAFENVEPDRKPIMPGTDGDMILNPQTGRYEFRPRARAEEQLIPPPNGQPVVQQAGMYLTWNPKTGMYGDPKPLPPGGLSAEDIEGLDSFTQMALAQRGQIGRGRDFSGLPEYKPGGSAKLGASQVYTHSSGRKYRRNPDGSVEWL